MNRNQDDLSSRDYEREAEATRGRLARNLAELNDRLTPGQVFDEVLTYAKGGGGSFLRSLGNAARENPIPSLLIGAGCMMFMSERMGLLGHGSNGRRAVPPPRSKWNYGANGGNGDSRYRDNGRSATDFVGAGMASAAGYAGDTASTVASGVRHGADYVRSSVASAAGYAGDKVSSLAEGVRERVGYVGSGVAGAAGYATEQGANLAGSVRDGAGAVGSSVAGAADYAGTQAANLAEGLKQGAGAVSETVAGTAQRVRESLAGAAGSVVQGAHGVGEAVHGYTSAIGSQVSHTADRTMRQASQVTHQVKDKASAIINEQPLLIAAVGVAVGAAIAAIMPSTRAEDEIMGEASDAVKQAARGVASEQFATAKAAVGRVAEEAKTIAEREGLTPAVAADAARLVSDRVTKVATEVANTGKAELRVMADRAMRQG